MSEESILKLKAKTTELADCWLWSMATTADGYPATKVDGRSKLVRRWMFELNGGTLMARLPIVTTCGEKLCINPEHLKSSTAKKVAKEAAKRGVWSGLARCAKIAQSKRGSAKISMEIAQTIRFSKDTQKKLAERYGINRTLVHRIRNGTAWKDYSNPFQGLMG